MRIILTDHARQRAEERWITVREIESVIKFPDRIARDRRNPELVLFKKVYYHKKLKKRHLLILICDLGADLIRVITIIDTSKVTKYL